MFFTSLFKKIAIFGSIGASFGVTTVVSMSMMGTVKLTSETPEYVCSFYNYDQTLLYSCKVERDHNALYVGPNPERPSDEIYSYRFNGWDNSLSSIRQDMKYMAQYEASTRDYTITFINYNGEQLYEVVVAADTVPFYAGQAPYRPSNDQYDYVFDGWDKPLVEATKNEVYTATYKQVEKEYEVSFYNYDDTLLDVAKVSYGGRAVYGGTTPIRDDAPEGAQYYFSNWDKDINSVTENMGVKAEFELKYYNYTVTFEDDEGNVLFIDRVRYGEDAEYEGETPYKEPDENGSYRFIGWDKSLENVREDFVAVAVFQLEKKECLVTFLNYDETVLYTATVEFGGTAKYEGETPTKPSTDKMRYVFDHWDRKLNNVTKDFYTYAIYDSQLFTYSITFMNYDGTEVLETVEVEYGGDGTYLCSETPTKPSDDQYRYVFKEWNEDLSYVTKDIETIPLFEAIPLDAPGEGGEGSGGSGSGSEGEGEGEGGGGGNMPVPPGNLAYVTFHNWDGTYLDRDMVLVGEDASYDEALPEPARADNVNHSDYIFRSWDKTLNNVEKSFDTYAQYIVEGDWFDEYIVTFRNDDGRLIYESYCYENDMPSYDLPEVPKSKDGGVFVGWDRALVPATDSYTLYAVYQPVGFGGSTSGGSGSTSGDVSGGNGSEAFGDMTKEAVFTFQSAYSGSVYFRESSKSNLTDNTWEPAYYYNLGNDVSPLFYTSDTLARAGFASYSLNITYPDTFYYSLVPDYTTNYSNTISDSYCKPNEELEYTYNFMPMTLTEDTYNSFKDYHYGGSDASLVAKEVTYRDYVRDNYLEVDAETREFITKFVRQNNLKVSSIFEILKTSDFLSTYAKYNVKAEAYPEGANNTIYFLETAREGICNNFASALTVIYRTLGLPSRFVTGYMAASPGENTLTTVYNTNAHAWVEIYLDGYGWFAVDPTAGAEVISSLNTGQGGEGESAMEPEDDPEGEPQDDEKGRDFFENESRDKDSSSTSQKGLDPDQNLPDNTLFEYSADYGGIIYLRDKSYADYDGFTWTDDNRVSEYDDENAVISPLEFLSDKLNQLGYTTYTITTNDPKAKVLTIPSYCTDNIAGEINDSYVGAYSSSQNTYTFIPKEMDVSLLEQLASTSFSSEAITSQEANYREYVRDNYLGLTDYERTYLEAFIQENNLKADSYEDLIEVWSFVKSYAPYNLYFEAWPEDIQDAAIYFLDVAKEGICNNFASAATLIYRALGVPARYVDGFLTVSRKDDITEVTNMNRHAWTEIYLDGIGWVRIDATGSPTGEQEDPGAPESFDPSKSHGYITVINQNGTRNIKFYESTNADYSVTEQSYFFQEGDMIWVVYDGSYYSLDSYKLDGIGMSSRFSRIDGYDYAVRVNVEGNYSFSFNVNTMDSKKVGVIVEDLGSGMYMTPFSDKAVTIINTDGTTSSHELYERDGGHDMIVDLFFDSGLLYLIKDQNGTFRTIQDINLKCRELISLQSEGVFIKNIKAGRYLIEVTKAVNDGYKNLRITPDNDEGHHPTVYSPFGVLNQSELLVTIDYGSERKEYDGEAMDITPTATGALVHPGDVFEYNIFEVQSEVGLYTVKTMVRVFDTAGNDVTDDYFNKVKVQGQYYYISPKTITITTGSDTKAYDGEALTKDEYALTGDLIAGHEIIIDIIGSQTLKGTSDNFVDGDHFEIRDEYGVSVTNNYRVIWVYGKLTVN